MQSICECFYIADAGVIVRPEETADNARRTSSAAPDLHLSTATTPRLANAFAAVDPLVKQRIAVFETKLDRLRDAPTARRHRGQGNGNRHFAQVHSSPQRDSGGGNCETTVRTDQARGISEHPELRDLALHEDNIERDNQFWRLANVNGAQKQEI